MNKIKKLKSLIEENRKALLSGNKEIRTLQKEIIESFTKHDAQECMRTKKADKIFLDNFPNIGNQYEVLINQIVREAIMGKNETSYPLIFSKDAELLEKKGFNVKRKTELKDSNEAGGEIHLY